MIARNSLVNFGGYALSSIVALITVPATVRVLGPERFGLLALVWLVLGYFGVFDLGIGRASTKVIAEALAEERLDKVRRVASTSMILVILLGSLTAIAMASIASVVATEILRLPPNLVSEGATMLLVLAAAIPVTFAGLVARSVLEAGQRFDLVNVVASPATALTYVISLIGAFLGWYLPITVALIVVGKWGAAIAYMQLGKRVDPGLWREWCFSMEDAHTLWRYGRWVTGYSVVGPMLVYADRLLVGGILGVATLAYYAAPFEMITRVWIVPVSVAMSLFPAFAARGRSASTSVLYANSVRYVAVAVAPLVIGSILFSREVLTLLFGTAFAAQSRLPLELFAIGVFISSLSHMPMAYLQGTGRPDLIAKILAIEIGPYVVLTYFLINAFGLDGAALGWLIRVTADNVAMFLVAGHTIQNFGIGAHLRRTVFATGVLGVMVLSALLLAETSAAFLPRMLFGLAIACGLPIVVSRWVVVPGDLAMARRIVGRRAFGADE